MNVVIGLKGSLFRQSKNSMTPSGYDRAALLGSTKILIRSLVRVVGFVFTESVSGPRKAAGLEKAQPLASFVRVRKLRTLGQIFFSYRMKRSVHLNFRQNAFSVDGFVWIRPLPPPIWYVVHWCGGSEGSELSAAKHKSRLPRLPPWRYHTRTSQLLSQTRHVLEAQRRPMARLKVASPSRL